MTKATYMAIRLLSRCRFAPGTPEKRFIKQMSAKEPDASLTEAQLMYLGKLYFCYRKQIEDLKRQAQTNET